MMKEICIILYCLWYCWVKINFDNEFLKRLHLANRLNIVSHKLQLTQLHGFNSNISKWTGDNPSIPSLSLFNKKLNSTHRTRTHCVINSLTLQHQYTQQMFWNSWLIINYSIHESSTTHITHTTTNWLTVTLHLIPKGFHCWFCFWSQFVEFDIYLFIFSVQSIIHYRNLWNAFIIKGCFIGFECFIMESPT